MSRRQKTVLEEENEDSLDVFANTENLRLFLLFVMVQLEYGVIFGRDGIPSSLYLRV